MKMVNRFIIQNSQMMITIIVFDYGYTNGRDIAKVNTDGSGFEYLIQT